MNFWEKLPKGFLALAPMEDVTDSVFRRVVTGVGRPDVMFTEFTSVDAIVYAIRNPQKSVLDSQSASRFAVPLRAVFAGIPALQRLFFTEEERPIVAQIWGVDPEKFRQAARVIRRLGFDGIDINLGCPVRDVIKKGACSGMIGDNVRVAEIIAAVKEAGLPVSVKTRIGYKKIITEEWVGFLLEQGLAAVTIHGRTAAEMSKVPANWEEIGKAVRVRDSLVRAVRIQRCDCDVLDRPDRKGRAPAARVVRNASICSPAHTLIIGNGDVKDLEDARQKVDECGVDGVMIGRGVLEDPWIFDNSQTSSHKPQERVDLLKRHLELWEETWGESKNFANFKKYVKIYVRDFAGAGELRARLMETKKFSEMEKLLG